MSKGIHLIHMVAPGRTISVCPWCDEDIHTNEQYAFEEELGHLMHLDCYIARKEAKLYEKDGV